MEQKEDELMKRLGMALVCLSLAASALAADAPQKSLYVRLGGYDALAAVTDDFIGRLATDKSLARFFAGHSKDSLGKIRQLVVDQLCAATGGPCLYIGRDMKTAHQGMGISEADWNAAVGHLTATLGKFKVPEKEKNEVLGAISSFKNDIVEQKPMK
jgi:hemoglobin